MSTNKVKPDKDKKKQKEEKKVNPNNKDKNQNDKSKSLLKENKEEEEKKNLAQSENPKNIERYIYITKYSDINSVKIINQLFQDINSSAFNLTSKNDIISKVLTNEEQNNNEIDYISGFQIIDSKIRLTVIEGITNKSMLEIKKALPKAQMNNDVIKIFSDCSILFNQRIYSKFNLSLKYIKLRKSLSDILTTFDIYKQANKYRNVYVTFMNFGTILRAETLEDINNCNAFPDPDKLIELERKFSEILNIEDMTGIKKNKKNENIKNLLISLDDNNTTLENIKNNKSSQNGKSILVKSMKLMPIKKQVHFLLEKEKKEFKENDKNNSENIVNINKSKNNRYLTIDNVRNNKNNNYDLINNNSQKIDYDSKIPQLTNNNINSGYSNKINLKLINNLNYNTIETNGNNNSNYSKILLTKTAKIDTKNKTFINILKERENKKISLYKIFNRNKKYLNRMLRKKSSERFCQPFEGEYDKKKEILFNPCKLNHYEELVNEMRKKYNKDNNHYYSYSEKSLTLSFPMVEGFRNEEYIKYIENKSKWLIQKDFDRYKQPEREKIFFPRINKEI